MPTKVIMPTLGLTMEQGTINQWLKREGDPVEKDEPIFVVETDKAAMEVGAPASGILKKILAPEGATVPVQQVIAWITQPGEELPDDLGGAPASAPRAAAASAATVSDGTSATSPAPVAAVAAPGDRLKASPRARRLARELGVDLLEVQGSGPGGRIVEADVRRYVELRRGEEERVKASPVARKLAEELGVSLASVTGTGPGGRITREDVEAAARRAAAAASPPPAAPTPAPPVPAVGEVVPLGRIRRVTAERMAQSARSVARVTLLMEVDMTEAVRFRNQLAPEFERRYGAKLVYDAMIAKAAAMALAEHRYLNAQWADEGVRLMPRINVGVAVAIPDGLVVPVIHDADQKPLGEVSAKLVQLAQKAREGKLSLEDLTGGTFTITNLGGYGVEAFTPIVNPPEAAILGVGRIAKRPAVVDDQIVVRDLMYLSLAFDHRVTDGAPAAQFLQRVKELLENPYRLLA